MRQFGKRYPAELAANSEQSMMKIHYTLLPAGLIAVGVGEDRDAYEDEIYTQSFQTKAQTDLPHYRNGACMHSFRVNTQADGWRRRFALHLPVPTF